MKLRPWSLKLMLNIFPALFFQRVIVKKFSPDFRTARVKVRRSLLNKNLNRTVFGGTIFSAADPIYSMMYWQIFEHQGISCLTWLKSARIDYIKPADTHLYLHFSLSDAQVEEAKNALELNGKFEKWHEVHALNKQGEICATVHILAYLKIKKEKKDN